MTENSPSSLSLISPSQASICLLSLLASSALSLTLCAALHLAALPVPATMSANPIPQKPLRKEALTLHLRHPPHIKPPDPKAPLPLPLRPTTPPTTHDRVPEGSLRPSGRLCSRKGAVTASPLCNHHPDPFPRLSPPNQRTPQAHRKDELFPAVIAARIGRRAGRGDGLRRGRAGAGGVAVRHGVVFVVEEGGQESEDGGR